MIVLDTNVISTALRVDPHPGDQAAREWLATLAPGELLVTAISRAETAYGIALLPEGRRRSVLEAAARVFYEVAERQTLSFGPVEAESCGKIMAERRQAGNPISVLDAQIAACALVAKAALATRDVGGFEGVGLRRLINPWDPGTWW